jgi:hypothetical protein
MDYGYGYTIQIQSNPCSAVQCSAYPGNAKRLAQHAIYADVECISPISKSKAPEPDGEGRGESGEWREREN